MSAQEKIAAQGIEPVFPLYSTVKDTVPAQSISLAGLRVLADNPSVGEKEKAQALTPYSADGKQKADALDAMYHAVVVDHDHDDLGRDEIQCLYDSFGVPFLAYTTTTHQRPDNHSVVANRWRVVIPLAAPVDAKQYQQLAQGIAQRLGTDAAQARTQQVFFAPNKADETAPYEFIDCTTQPFLNADDRQHPFVVNAIAGWQEIQRDKAAKAQSAKAKPRKPMDATQGSIIERVIQSHSLRDVLESNGYKRDGGDYLSPTSSSGNAGVHILERDGKEVCYSHHGDTDPLSAMNNNGHALDVFDVLVILEHHGDMSAAVKVLANQVDMEGQKDRQREWAKAKAPEAISQAGVCDSQSYDANQVIPKRFALLDGADLADNAKAPTYLIDEVLEDDAHGIMGGLSMTYKSFLALRMAYSICTGEPFMGRQVYSTGPVIYVCGEGRGGISRRWKALQLKLGKVPAGSFFLYNSPLQLRDATSMQTLKECIEEVRPALVIFDTFASLAGGIEENSPSEVGNALGNVRRVCQAGGASSLIVHHFGKDATKGFRGASNFTNDVDFAFMVNRPEGDQKSRKACMVAHKMKDGEPFGPIHFKALPVALGLIDQKGQEVYSLVVESDTAPGVDVAAIIEHGKAWEKALEALRICWNVQRDRLADSRPGANPAVTWDDWRLVMTDMGVSNPRRERDSLANKDLIECLSGNEYRPKD